MNIDHLIKNLKVIYLQPGEVIIREGDIGEKFYIILSGHMEILKM
jgi:CRP-like cAMP-binding protein